MILSPDARGQVDPTVKRNILDHLPELGIPIVPISYFPDFEFREPQVSDYVLVDFMEPHAEVDRYGPFWNWVGSRQPKLHFKRELGRTELIPGNLIPIDWPCHVPIPPTQSKEAFDARPLQIFFNWGYSNNSRPLLHADIFRAITTHGIEVISSFEELEKRDGSFPARTWAAIHTHCSVRRPIEEVLKWQQKAKISVSLFGNGKKCFRMAEAPVGSIMALPRNDMAWSYPWIEGDNCFLLHDVFPDGTEAGSYVDQLNWMFITPKNLYDIYVQSQETIRKYFAPVYAKEYVANEIKKVL